MYINQSIRDPQTAAAEVLRTYWDQSLPVRVDAIATQMGVGLHPTSAMDYSGHYFSVDDPNNGSGWPAIVFNTRDSANRQRFTIAHELGHHVLGHGTSPRDTSNVFSNAGNPRERAANQFAAELLMPANAIHLMINQGYGSVDQLAALFGVSTAAMGYRMINLGLGR